MACMSHCGGPVLAPMRLRRWDGFSKTCPTSISSPVARWTRQTSSPGCRTEYQPDAAYQELFETVLREGSARFALAVAVLTELVLAERGANSVLVSIARGGTPVGILMRRWAAAARGQVLPHYAVSLVRGPGVDTGALDYLARHHDPADVVFVDGWTGKGAIAEELSTSLARYRAVGGGAAFNDELAVLADPGSCVRTYGTRDDFLLPSACLNSTATGLVSRTVYSPSLTPPDGFHGAKFYRELARDDASHRLLDAVSDAFSDIADQVAPAVAAIRGSDRTPTWVEAGRPPRRCARSTASPTPTLSNPASVRPPACCCAARPGGFWSANRRPLSIDMSACSPRPAASRSRSCPTSPTRAWAC